MEKIPVTASPETWRILIIEDHSIYRNAVSRVLDTHEGYKCVGAFSNMEAALDAVESGLEADIILTDLGLPGMNGVSGIPKLREKLPLARLIVVTAFTDREKVFGALKAGAHGYLIKSGDTNRLVQTINEAANYGTPLDPQIAGMVLRMFQKLKPVVSDDGLSSREHQILDLISQGHTKSAVADELGISQHSVSTYLRRIFDKLHVHSLPAAVREAIRRGWLDLS
ncbi:response regulator transcription factor [Coraliomargarita sp. SDUM461004]|uniref:Response regulator transcription factor n=1 Tax=Thalassobacterium sedimentorum TaxID=3041258 RepID=A0ABU1AMS6_9BACT|nr:response regulator transcription factor [Coraliomargarita sp. SDUM461004]MDQ8196107.1 response regulator transcription factor [Coraliomargarita sp. SDUM461004]